MIRVLIELIDNGGGTGGRTEAVAVILDEASRQRLEKSARSTSVGIRDRLRARIGDFTSRDDLIDKIDTYVIEMNAVTKPYSWTYDGTPLKAGSPSAN